MNILFIAGLVLLALWLVETIVFLVAYRRSNRAAPNPPETKSAWRSSRPRESRVVPAGPERPGSTQTAMLS